jgi:hypothetical protein
VITCEECTYRAENQHPVIGLSVGPFTSRSRHHEAQNHQAYRAFGAKPRRTRNSIEALLRRADAGLPRVNRLTDIDNAISVKHLIRSRRRR